jgi:hypothetical protein
MKISHILLIILYLILTIQCISAVDMLLTKNEKKYNKTKSMKLYNASIFVLIYSTCMCNENNGKLFK